MSGRSPEAPRGAHAAGDHLGGDEAPVGNAGLAGDDSPTGDAGLAEPEVGDGALPSGDDDAEDLFGDDDSDPDDAA